MLRCFVLTVETLVVQEMKFDWRITVGTIVGFFGAALGSVGGVGGGGIFVPMLTLIIGFDPKSSTAISKCKFTDICYFQLYQCSGISKLIILIS